MEKKLYLPSVGGRWRIVVFCSFLSFSINAYSGIEEPLPGEDSLQSVTQVSYLSEHWSGLDRAALLKELSDGDLRAASIRIDAAANGSERENSECHILVELLTADMFREYKEALRRICKVKMDEVGRAKPKGFSEYKWNSRLLAQSMIYERFLHDLPAAERCNQLVLSKRKLQSDRLEDFLATSDEKISDHERIAATNLLKLDAKRKMQRTDRGLMGFEHQKSKSQ